MNNRGQMGMGLLMGMFTAVLVFIFLAAFLPTIIQMLGVTKGNDALNCPGYIDSDATTPLGGANNKTYNPSLESNTIGCSIINFTPGIFILSILFAIIAGIISGRLAMSQPEPQPYNPYQGY